MHADVPVNNFDAKPIEVHHINVNECANSDRNKYDIMQIMIFANTGCKWNTGERSGSEFAHTYVGCVYVFVLKVRVRFRETCRVMQN